jgi:hypothetical protein
MAHFAKIEDGRVTGVMVVDNAQCGGGEFPESEPIGQAYIAELGFEGVWLQTSYSGSFRRRYAAHEGYYNEEADVFYPQQPGPNWSLDEESWCWVLPNGTRLPNN